MNPAVTTFFFFSPKEEGLNRLQKFTSQGTCSHIHSEVFLANVRCFWDSVGVSPSLPKLRSCSVYPASDYCGNSLQKLYNKSDIGLGLVLDNVN